MKIEVYQQAHKKIWDQFVQQSKNSLFLFYRDYMEYHCDRFLDYSLLIWDDKDKLIALLPAHKKATSFISHDGLTYGGFIIDSEMKTPLMLEVFENVLVYLQQSGFAEFIYKTIPTIHHYYPAEEDRYALFLSNAQLIRRHVLTVVESKTRLPFQERRSRGVKKAIKANLIVKLTDDFASFWDILSSVLWETHQVKPVHNLTEILMLRDFFPDNIKLYACFQDNTMLGGVLVYENQKVARTQYIAADSLGRSLSALDLTFKYLLEEVYAHKSFFDFGPSNEDNGYVLNKGLIEQKEGFGGRAVIHDQYRIDLGGYIPGQCLKALNTCIS
jgi:hypothetical protein